MLSDSMSPSSPSRQADLPGKANLPPPPLLRLSQVASALNLSPSYLRKLTNRKRNPLPCTRLNNWERRFCLETVRKYLGIQINGHDAAREYGKVNVGLIARVSGAKQSKGYSKGSLDNDLGRQTVKLEDYAEERWGDSANLFKYFDTGSGLNWCRAGFLRFIDDLLSNRLDYFCTVTRDRTCRFGWDLIGVLSQYGKCEPVVLDNATEGDDVFADLAQDVLHITMYMNAKYNGRRSAKSNTVVLSTQAIEEIKRLADKGLSAFVIPDHLDRLGIRGEHPLKGEVKISYYLVRKFLDSPASGVVGVVQERKGLSPSSQNSFLVFKEKCLTEDETGEVKMAVLYKRYTEWATEKGLDVLNRQRVSKFLPQDAFPRKHDSTGRKVICGLKLRKEVKV